MKIHRFFIGSSSFLETFFIVSLSRHDMLKAVHLSFRGLRTLRWSHSSTATGKSTALSLS